MPGIPRDGMTTAPMKINRKRVTRSGNVSISSFSTTAFRVIAQVTMVKNLYSYKSHVLCNGLIFN